jgi:hypothetical protein
MDRDVVMPRDFAPQEKFIKSVTFLVENVLPLINTLKIKYSIPKRM